LLWGRHRAAREAFAARLADTDFRIDTTDRIDAIIEHCRLIVTATPSAIPLVQIALPGTHITAVGSDTATKQELAPALLAGADIVAVDSLPQSASRGEVYRAVQSGALSMDRVLELGAIIAGDAAGRVDDKQITVADLTGVATEDIEIATAIYRGLQHAD
jgi:ornithine cyclodeaminase